MKNPEILMFESRAKLMVSGEYFVLKGALALALPLRYGQNLTVEVADGQPLLRWETFIYNNLWLSATIKLPDFRILDSNLLGISETLVRILKAARTLNPDFLKMPQEYRITSRMDFNPAWGIGSSSSLVSNIAWWANCDPFELNNLIFNGSGYDIACARSISPIVYESKEDKPGFRPANFHPPFHRHLYFVYLNRKQSSKDSIRQLDQTIFPSKDIRSVSELTLDLEKTDNLEEFQRLMVHHEKLTGKIIHQMPVKESRFNDFAGSVKSLGAWGGDFILAASRSSEEYVRNYFINRNLTTIFNYSEIVLG